MSYILEALKRSQQERDLGRVPTLETPASPSRTHASGINVWILTAVVLAGLAVLIALYAAFRGVPSVRETAAAPEAAPRFVVEAVEQGADPLPSPVTGEGPAVEETLSREPAHSPEPVPVKADEGAPASAVSEQAPETSTPPSQEQTSSSAVARQPDEKVPEDLRRDIEDFKRQLRMEQTAEAEPPPAAVPPQKLKLPKEVKARLPDFLMTVHIFDEEPAKRFVLIDGRKLREGDETDKNILVEEILPDGVVLSYEGHKFFQHR